MKEIKTGTIVDTVNTDVYHGSINYTIWPCMATECRRITTNSLDATQGAECVCVIYTRPH